MTIEFNRYIRGKTLDLHELDNVDTTELLDFIEQKIEIKVLNLGRNSINDEYEEELSKRGIVVIEDCNEEGVANDLKDSFGSYLESDLKADLENGLETCNTNNTSKNVNQSQEKLKSNSKCYVCGATVGLVIGLIVAYCLGAVALTPVSVSVEVVIACTVIGALLGAGVGYSVGKCLDNIDVKNVQQEEVVKG